jgi:hypothetical protein
LVSRRAKESLDDMGLSVLPVQQNMIRQPLCLKFYIVFH